MNKFRYSLSRSRLAWALLIAPGVSVFAQDATDSDAELEELEAFTVTGSNIKRMDLETVNPVDILSSETLEDQGFTTIADALRALPFNNGQSLTPEDAGISFTPGVSTVNLRGLGNNQTLVLINGRRAAPYAAPGFDGLQTVFDLSSIPDNAIDRVEIVKDGASAIYGSDAVAGVFNVVLKDDFEGLNTAIKFGDFFDTGAFYRQGAITVGTSSAKTSILVAFSIEDQEAVFNRDLPFSADADQTNRAGSADGRWLIAGWDDISQDTKDFYGLETQQDLVGLIGFSDPQSDGWFDNRSSRGFPGYFGTSAGRVTFDADAYPNGVDDPTAEWGNSVGGSNLYNYQQVSGLLPSYRRMNFYTRAKYEFSETLWATLEASFSRMEIDVYAAATPVDIETSRGLDAADQLTIYSVIPYDYDGDGITEYGADLAPGEGYVNPMNPSGEDITNGRRRLVEFPARLSDVTSDSPRVVAVLGGSIFDSADWTWETGVVYSKNSVNTLNVVAVDSRLQQGFNGLTRLGDGSLVWDPTTDPSERIYFNWFGINEQAMVDHITEINPTSATFELYNYDIKTSGSIGELPGGPLGVAVGAEHRVENWTNTKTMLNATSDILGGSEGTSSAGERDLTAVFGELSLPILENLEMQVAGRFESYSDDGFAEEIRPKVALRYQPLSWLSLRAAYSEAFKAPDLAYLYTASQTSFSSGTVFDPVTSMSIDQIQVVTAGNPNLAPETSKNWYAGITIEPDMIEGLVFEAEYFLFDRSNMLAQLSDFYGYADFLTREFEGDPLFAGKVVRSSLDNSVLYIRDDYANISSAEYSGIDFGASYIYKTVDYGQFFFSWMTTWVESSTLDGSEQVGGYLTSEWTHNATATWSYGDWTAGLFGFYKSARTRNLNFGTILGEGDALILQYQVKSAWVWNANVSYSGIADTEITVGVNNLLNEEPPVDPWNGTGYTTGVNKGDPAFWWVRIERDF